MKKTLFAIASLAVLAMGCVKEQQPSAPAEQGEVTVLRVSVAPTKVAVNETSGACTWQEGDQMAVWYQGTDAGQKVVFTYKGLLEDGSAEFTTTETITDGYVATSVAHPVGSITETGGFTLVRDYTYNPDRIPVYVRSEEVVTNPDGSLSAQLEHNALIMQFTLRDIPAYAAGFVVKTSSNIEIKTSFPYKTGYSEDIVLNTVVPHSRTAESFYLIDGDGDVIEGTVKTFKNSPATVKGEFLKMGIVDFQKENLRKDYVKVCGIKWAKGNLQSKSTFAEEGFQPRWRIAPSQWHNFKYASAAAADQTEPARYDYTNNGDEFEHFNFGALARNSRFYSDGNFMKPNAALEISGKIYSDINGTNEVQGDDRFKEFAATSNADMWGDLAFWATKGKYRMPTNAEMQKFHNVSDKLLGYYVTSDGKKVWGVLLRTPNPTRSTNKAFIELTDADLESGVFLPNAGRRANSNSNGVIAVTTQGTYRTGTYISSKTVGDNLLYYSSYYHFATDAAKLYDGKLGAMGDAYDHAAGFLIRPVLVETVTP